MVSGKNIMVVQWPIFLDNVGQRVLALALFVVVLWIVYLIDVVLRRRLTRWFGLRPRERFNFLAMIFFPFLHINRRHISANTVPFFLLGSLVMIYGEIVFELVTLIIIWVSGMGIWLLGRSNSIHTGASVLILGYFGFLLANAVFSPERTTIVIAVIVVIFYLGLITQIFPLRKGVSTMGHFFGFVGGVLAATINAVIVIVS